MHRTHDVKLSSFGHMAIESSLLWQTRFDRVSCMIFRLSLYRHDSRTKENHAMFAEEQSVNIAASDRQSIEHRLLKTDMNALHHRSSLMA
jgi:hypothetical protein